MLLYYDKKGIVKAVSNTPIMTNVLECIDVDLKPGDNPVGKKIVRTRDQDAVRVAMICNWGDACGIATYSSFLADALRQQGVEVKVFAEKNDCGNDPDISYCWRRGESMLHAVQEVMDWGPTHILVQHEFGIFPKATHFLRFAQALEDSDIPHAYVLHSVYEHLDKTICTSAMKNIVVHTRAGEECLRRLGHKDTGIDVIPHGCVVYDDVHEEWNITQTPYAIVQFGFGFKYKGVENVIRAVSRLKVDQPEKYGDIHYCYLCSENPHTKNVTREYYDELIRLVEELGLTENVVIIRGYHSETILNNYLRTYKLAVFPYVSDPKNVVYGASGAIRIAMANEIPTIASTSHMFDDLQGVVPRCDQFHSNELAILIDNVFSDGGYRRKIVENCRTYVRENSWQVTARRYLDALRRIERGDPDSTILV